MRKYIDLEVYNKYGPEGYFDIKSKGGKVGGKISRLPRPTQIKNAEALVMSRMTKNTVTVLCIKDINGYVKGKKYTLTFRVENKHPIIERPIPLRFDRWINFVDYFKRFKTK